MRFINVKLCCRCHIVQPSGSEWFNSPQAQPRSYFVVLISSPAYFSIILVRYLDSEYIWRCSCNTGVMYITQACYLKYMLFSKGKNLIMKYICSMLFRAIFTENMVLNTINPYNLKTILCIKFGQKYSKILLWKVFVSYINKKIFDKFCLDWTLIKIPSFTFLEWIIWWWC